MLIQKNNNCTEDPINRVDTRTPNITEFKLLLLMNIQNIPNLKDEHCSIDLACSDNYY
jgi:hypothetical protein